MGAILLYKLHRLVIAVSEHYSSTDTNTHV